MGSRPRHPDLLAVVEERRSGQGQQDGRGQLGLVHVPAEDAHRAVLVVVGQKGRIGPGRMLGQHGIQRPSKRRRLALVDRIQDAPGQPKLEAHVEVGRPILGDDVGAGPRLPDADGLGVGALVVVPEGLEVREGPRVVLVGVARVDEVLDGVVPEPVHAEAEPMVDDVVVVLDDVRVLDVPIRHAAPEQAVVPAVDRAVPIAARVAVRPDVPVAERVARTGGGRQEMGVLAGAVVADEVYDDADSAGVAFVHERLEIRLGAIVGIDPEVIRDVIPVIGWRRVDGHEPNAADSKVRRGGGVSIVEVVELGEDALKIPNAVPVTVLERPHENLIERGLGLPGGRSRLTRHPQQPETGCRAGEEGK